MKLYTYFRSSAAYRVRIVINLKQINCELIPVSLIKDGGENHQRWYLDKNQSALVPTLELDDGSTLRQSFAIIDYLEQHHPIPPLLPQNPLLRAKVLALSCDVGMEIHPLNNLRTLKHLKSKYKFDQDMTVEWMQHWMHATFAMMEKTVESDSNCVGDDVTLADVFLIPQIYNALRWQVDMSAYPRLMCINTHLNQLPAFTNAHPKHQPDTVQ